MSTGGEPKIIAILEAARAVAEKLSLRAPRAASLAEATAELYRQLPRRPNDVDLPYFRVAALLPVEAPHPYALPVERERGRGEEALSSGGFSIASVDGSYMEPSPHVLPQFLLINVGAWVHNYGAGGKPRSFVRAGAWTVEEIVGDWALEEAVRLKIREFEAAVALEACEYMKGEWRIMLLDGSLNLSYTTNWRSEMRKEYARLTAEGLKAVLSKGVVPVGVFHTRSDDLAWAAYKLVRCAGKPCDPPSCGAACRTSIAMDRVLADRVLSDYERTPLLRLQSRVLGGLVQIYAFYLKFGARNVVRVEFPYDREPPKELVDAVHLAVAAQAELGKGYPYAMSRAHELAVLTQKDRDAVMATVAKALGFPSADMLFSAKCLSKMRPIS